MSRIDITNLTFSYDGSYDTIFDNVSFQIDTDWKLGFTGRNGRGKTTFLNLLLGKYEYRGSIKASVDFEYFPFPVADKTWDTIDIIYSIVFDTPLWQIKKELSLLDVKEEALYRPFDTLSNGEQTKILLASLFLKENRFLLIDEPTNHLDSAARSIISKYLNSKKGFILVSHDRKFLDNCVDHILSINKADIEIQSGNFSSWYHNKQMQDKFELEQNARLKKDIKRLETAAKQNADWSDSVENSKIGNHAGDRGYIGHKAAKMMKRSKAIETRRQKESEEKSKLLKNLEESDDLKIMPEKYHSDKLIQLDNISVSYGNTITCEHVSFTVSQGDRIALYGKNGSGKSSILKLICGVEINYSGYLYRASGLKISYVTQDTSNLCGNLNEFIASCQIEESLFKTILSKLDFSREQFEKDMGNYSEGQKKKVLLAKSLCERAHLYVWDEPFNFIDVLSRMQIENLILTFGPTLLFVEHDNAFAEKTATKIVQL